MDVCECSQVSTQPQIIRVRLKKLNSSILRRGVRNKHKQQVKQTSVSLTYVISIFLDAFGLRINDLQFIILKP